MAAKETEMERGVSEETEPRAKLTCSICLDAYKEPKVLPCCHTFCRACLEGLAAKTEGKFKCPECRTEHDVPDRGVEGFLTDFSLVGEIKSKESGGKETVCGECEDGERAVAYCHDCETFVCEGCKLALHKPKRYRNHFIQSLSEEISYKRDGDTSGLTCPCHPPEKKQTFCKTCQCLVCVHCIVEKHQQHTLGRINDETCREVREQLIKHREKAVEQRKNFEQHMRHVKSVEELVQTRPEKLRQAINEAIDTNIAQLESRRQTLLEQVESRYDDIKAVWAQKEHVSVVTVGLKSALSFSERVLQCSSKAEFLSLAPQTCSRLEELNLLTWEPGDLNRIKRSTVYFTCKELSPLTFGSLEERVRSTLCIEGLSPNIELGQPVELKIVEKDMQQSEIWSTRASLQVTVEDGTGYYYSRRINNQRPYQRNNYTLQPQLSPHGQWMVTFTPACRGQHTVSVLECGLRDRLATSTTSVY